MAFISTYLIKIEKEHFLLPFAYHCIAGFRHFWFALLNCLMFFLISTGSAMYIVEEILTHQPAASTFLFVSVIFRLYSGYIGSAYPFHIVTFPWQASEPLHYTLPCDTLSPL